MQATAGVTANQTPPGSRSTGQKMALESPMYTTVAPQASHQCGCAVYEEGWLADGRLVLTRLAGET
jgi:hypothetical protein